MIRAMSSAVTGLRGHQQKLDVVGNNIANVNTVGFKMSQARFEDLISQTIQGATAPLQRGGINPSQVGMGTRVSSITDIHSQGALTSTDRVTDLAIEGAGFFVLTDVPGSGNRFYTRDGSFNLDANGTFVNSRGLYLTDFATNAISIPIGDDWLAQATTMMRFAGNLDARGYLGPVDEEQRIDLDGPIGGTYTLRFRDDVTGPLNFDDDAATVQAALEGLDSIGAGNVIVSAVAGGFQVQFTGDLGESDLASLRLDSSNLIYGVPTINVDTPGVAAENAEYSLDFSDVTDGDFRISINPDPADPAAAVETAPITFDADPAVLRDRISDALAALAGYAAGDFNVTESGLADITIEFTGDLAGQPVDLGVVDIDLNALPVQTTISPGVSFAAHTQTINLQGAASGTFRLQINHDGTVTTTDPLCCTMTAEELEAALANFTPFGVNDFTVTEGGRGVWEVVFLGNHNATPILDLTVIDPENLDYGNEPGVETVRSGREERIVPHDYEYYVYDSLGRRLNVDFTFTPVTYNRWNYTVQVSDEGGNAIPLVGPGGGVLVFDENGAIDEGASGIPNIEFNPPGEAAEMIITPDFSAASQLAGSNSLLAREQDGYAAGTLASFNISRTGQVIGTYTNGLVQTFGQVETVTFPNPEGLIKEGGNLFRETVNSGEPAAGIPGEGGRGLLQSSALEMSNVDLAYEFTELITTSRGFQANTRVVTTSDEVLVEVINMKR